MRLTFVIRYSLFANNNFPFGSCCHCIKNVVFELCIKNVFEFKKITATTTEVKTKRKTTEMKKHTTRNESKPSFSSFI